MEAPKLPINNELTYIGTTSYRDKNQLFGIKRKDRRQHVYILGKSGTGKSVLMFNMIIQNIRNGDGVCVVDPHGELVEEVVAAIPTHRIKDVVYFNPADPDYHIGFNVLELIDPKYKHLVASGLMGIFTKIWANAWSARMEYILNNAILALLDTPGTTLLGIQRMLVDKDYRQKIISNLKDPVIKTFWVHEYEAWQDKFRNEAIAPIQNKVGQFLSTSIIRNVVGQSVSTINIFDIMNEGKIFLVNVSKGRIGEDNSALLGGMIITKIQLAAMERVRIPEDERKDFYLYVDEFQNFVTDSFAGILSEARKYRLNLTVAHQYTAQLVSDKSSSVRDAVFGNVGTMIVFRVGADDADFLEKEFDPEFTPQDILSLPNYKIYLKLMIDGITSRPFSAKTMPPITKGEPKISEEVIKSSRALYCKSKEVVEREINNWSGMALGNDDALNGVEKFSAKCSVCKKGTLVPFKPEPGRAIYCKECIAKLKSGELKPIKGSINQIRYDEAKFFKPLSDLGIEFEQKGQIQEERYPERPDKGHFGEEQKRTRPGIFSAIKKVFDKNEKPKQELAKNTFVKNKQKSTHLAKGENLALKEILNKTLAETLNENKVEPVVNITEEIKIENKNTAESMSLDNLKISNQNSNTVLKDRSASAEEMNKLKDLISAKETIKETTNFVPKVQEKIIEPIQKEIPKEILEIKKEELKQEEVKKEEIKKDEVKHIPNQAQTHPSISPTGTIREVPEDVLRKILE
ncbi:MAG TPA: type IV secretion system DNA-binding domain-containing protein [Candidatus Paceibacterota bacterium]|nr:type IV secretion system DNA-binding domain-containing protein [Candidatus Paceibacterota bacterium]HPT18153.1 type IV secretion system DNA-binding domain-containing protein [Candidatus Paceibacterota bacterium]